MTLDRQRATAVQIPPAHTFAWTLVQALRELGGSGHIEEINEKAVSLRALTEDQQLVPHARGNRTAIEYRLAWARSLAKMLGLVTNSERGVWSLTERGETVTQEEVDQLRRDWHRARAAKAVRTREGRRSAEEAGVIPAPDDVEDPAAVAEDQDWKEQLLDLLKELAPDAFERLAKRLLREANFVNVTVTGGSSDGGIDGAGVYRLSLVSFPVYFQCKRYQGTVGASKVRDFAAPWWAAVRRAC